MILRVFSFYLKYLKIHLRLKTLITLIPFKINYLHFAYKSNQV